MLRLSAFLFYLWIVCANGCWAKPVHHLSDEWPPGVRPFIKSTSDFGWTLDSWTADEKPYVAIKDSIFKKIKEGQSPVALLNEYRADLLKTRMARFDSKPVFSFAYACFQANMQKEYRLMSQITYAVSYMQNVPLTHSYEFNRLHFLVNCACFPSREYLRLGYRLLEKDPNDIPVRYYVVVMLDPASYPEEKARAIEYANDLITARPNDPNMQCLLGGVYFVIWLRTHSTEDGEKAVAAYEKYLQGTPMNDPEREHFVITVQWIKTGKLGVPKK